MKKHATATKADDSKEPEEDVQLADAQQAANDADEPVPRYVVTAEQRQEFERDAEALPAEEVAALPHKPEAQLDWMDGLQATAWRDRAEIVMVSLDGRHVTLAEIHRFGARIEWARGVVAAWRVGAATASPVVPVASPEVALKRAMAADQKTVHRALAMRFRKSPEQRRELARVARLRADKHLSARNASLLSMCADAEVEGWLRSLPRGEGAALDRLRARHAEWVRRRKQGAPTAARKRALKGLAAKAFALLRADRERIVAAGRYLVEGRDDRKGDYAGFRDVKRTRKGAPKSG